MKTWHYDATLAAIAIFLLWVLGQVFLGEPGMEPLP